MGKKIILLKVGRLYVAKSITKAEPKSKYNPQFTQHTKTDFSAFPTSMLQIELESIIALKRLVEVVITPQQLLNKLEFFTMKPIAFM